jgi:hypothetical protein
MKKVRYQAVEGGVGQFRTAFPGKGYRLKMRDPAGAMEKTRARSLFLECGAPAPLSDSAERFCYQRIPPGIYQMPSSNH